MPSFKASRNLVVTLGQSLNSEPGGSGVNSYFQQLRQRMFGRAMVVRGYIPGIGWLQWKKDDWKLYYDYWATKAERVVFNMNGGQGDYAFNRTGAQTYADASSIAVYVKSLAAAGKVKVIGASCPDGDNGLNTTVAVSSNGVDVTTWAGAGVLNVVSTTAPFAAIAPTNTVYVQTSTGVAIVTYTGTTATSLTGLTTTSGTGTVATGNYVRQKQRQMALDGNALMLSDANVSFDAKIDYFAVLPDATNTTYFQSDKVHETAAGAKLMLDALQPSLEALLL